MLYATIAQCRLQCVTRIVHSLTGCDPTIFIRIGPTAQRAEHEIRKCRPQRMSILQVARELVVASCSHYSHVRRCGAVDARARRQTFDQRTLIRAPRERRVDDRDARDTVFRTRAELPNELRSMQAALLDPLCRCSGIVPSEQTIAGLLARCTVPDEDKPHACALLRFPDQITERRANLIVDSITILENDDVASLHADGPTHELVPIFSARARAGDPREVVVLFDPDDQRGIFRAVDVQDHRIQQSQVRPLCVGRATNEPRTEKRKGSAQPTSTSHSDLHSRADVATQSAQVGAGLPSGSTSNMGPPYWPAHQTVKHGLKRNPASDPTANNLSPPAQRESHEDPAADGG
jgi:hypothetical protein